MTSMTSPTTKTPIMSQPIISPTRASVPEPNHTGAIVGGVVGGPAGLAILIVVGGFIVHQIIEKRRERASDPMLQMTENVAGGQ
jgi:hypothetical protein